MPPRSAPAPRNPASHGSHGSPGSRPRGRAGYRPIPGRYDPARLPIAVRPVPDEPAASWAVRLAHRYQIAVQPLLGSLGIEAHAWSLQNFHATLRPHHGVLCDALGLPEQELFLPDKTTEGLRHMLDRYFAEYRPHRTRGPAGTRYCPPCLRARDGAWKQAWAQPLAMMCLEHQVELRTVCPRCGRPPWTSGAWLTGAGPGWECSQPVKTAQAGPRRRVPRCGYDLRAGPLLEPVDVKAALTIQSLVDTFAVLAATTPEQTGDFAGRLFRYDDLFFALMEVLNASTPQHAQKAEPFWISAPPGQQLSRLAAGVLALASDDPDTAATHLDGVLRPSSKQAPLYTVANLRRHQHNPVLGHIMLTAHAGTISPTMQLSFRTANPRPRYPTEPVRVPQPDRPARDGELPFTAIPQLLWPDALPPGLHRDSLDRATDAMLLARLGTLRAWQHIAIELQLPAAFRTRPPARHRWRRKQDLWPRLRPALDALATRLAEHPPPIDYQQRRRICFDGTLLIRAAERVLSAGANPLPALDAAAWARMFWQVYTEGDLRLTPPPLGLP
ncbi:MAG: TniQ family protein, partial [Microlunatus sp.]|nr:TniQ family protein [Microlunatus sp.]